MERLYFSGHETFQCRNYWLKKGLDFIWQKKRFSDDDAVVYLGVGKNMVSSIRFWLKAFNLTDEEDRINEVAEKLFHTDRGFDPYCEDIGTIWLLHHYIVTHKRSSIYHLVFNEFRKQRVEFHKDHLQNFLERYCRTRDVNFNSNSISRDISVFINNYLLPANASKAVEDSFSGLLYELNLVHSVEKSEDVRKGKLREWYRIENTSRENLPFQIVLFCILANEKYGDSVTFNELLNDTDSVGSVFALSSQGLMAKLERIIQHYPKELVFTDDGGVRVLQFKRKIDHWDVLSRYYEK